MKRESKDPEPNTYKEVVIKILNENTRQVLSVLTDINKIGVIQYPLMNIKSESGAVIGFFSTQAMGEEEFESYGIFNISELLQVISLIEKPEIGLDNGVIHIEGDNTKIKYITTDLGILGEYTRIKDTILTKTKEADTIVEFKLSENDFSKIKKASDVFKNLEDFIININNNEIFLEVSESDERIVNSNSYKLKVQGNCNLPNGKDSLKISIAVKNLKLIPTGNYTVQVKYNKSKDAYRLLMSSEDINTLEFILSIKVS